jgi:hypothetical protein
MGDSILWKYWLAWALFSSPAVPLAYALRRRIVGPRVVSVADILPLAVAALSLVWFDAAVASWWFLAPLSSRLHYAFLGGNLAAVLFSALLSFFSSFSAAARKQRLAVTLACLMLVFEWGWIGAATR